MSDPAQDEFQSFVGPLLTSPPPSLSEAAVGAALKQYWGLSGPLRPLTSERDLNFHLSTPEGGLVVKIANSAEPLPVTRLQSSALIHLATAAPDLPVPRVRFTQEGQADVILPSGHLMRVLTYLEGQPLHQVPRSTPQRRAMGNSLARLTLGLQGFDDPAAGHDLLWDIRHALRLRGLLPAIADAEVRLLCQRVLDRFEDHVDPVLPQVRWQIVHNDLNPHNVVVDPADPDRVAGILDFGDMVRTPLVCDLGVAAAYQIDAANAIGSLVDFAGAYHAVLPLWQAERDILFDLVCARMVTTLAITSWRAVRYPENAPYILRNFAAARAGLMAFASLSPATVQAALAQACPQEVTT
jgi:hydroxylysine kinase